MTQTKTLHAAFAGHVAQALDALEEQAMKENPSLEVAAARMEAARAQAGISDADLFPTLTAGAGPERPSTRGPARWRPARGRRGRCEWRRRSNYFW